MYTCVFNFYFFKLYQMFWMLILVNSSMKRHFLPSIFFKQVNDECIFRMKMLIRLKRTIRNVHHTPLKFNWTLFIFFLIFFPACISYPSWNGAIMSMTWIFDVNNIVNSTHKFRFFFHVLCSRISEMTFDNVVHICAVLNKKLIVHLVYFVKNKKNSITKCLE